MTIPRDADGGLLDAGYLEEAEKLYLGLARTEPAVAQFGLGKVQLARGRHARAEQHFWRALRADGRNHGIREWIAHCRLARGDAEGALKLAFAAAKAGSRTVMNRHSLARALAATGRLKDARDVLLDAIISFPDALELQVLLARVSWDLGERRGPMLQLAGIIERDPDCEPAWELSAMLLLEAGKVEQAEQMLRGAVQADPTARSLQFLLAEILLRTGRTEAVRERLEILEALAEGQADLWLELGALHAELGDPGAAVACFDAALNAYPEGAEALYRLGGFAEASEQLEAAVDFYRRAVASDDLHAGARARLEVLRGVS